MRLCQIGCKKATRNKQHQPVVALPVCHRFDEHGAVLLGCDLARALGGQVHGKDVVAIDAD